MRTPTVKRSAPNLSRRNSLPPTCPRTRACSYSVASTASSRTNSRLSTRSGAAAVIEKHQVSLDDIGVFAARCVEHIGQGRWRQDVIGVDKHQVAAARLLEAEIARVANSGIGRTLDQPEFIGMSVGKIATGCQAVVGGAVIDQDDLVALAKILLHQTLQAFFDVGADVEYRHDHRYRRIRLR